MHELSLIGHPVLEENHWRLLRVLEGLCRMQAVPVEELHLVFATRSPPGRAALPALGDSTAKPEVQRISKILASNIYYVHVVGCITSVKRKKRPDPEAMNGDASHDEVERTIQWHFEFKDIPDATGQQVANGRTVFRFSVEGGDIIEFMKQFGYDYVSRHVQKGHKLRDEDEWVIFFLSRGYEAPDVEASKASDWSFMNRASGQEVLDNTGAYALPDNVLLFDKSGAYTLQASVDIVDANVSEDKDTAIAKLSRMRDILKPEVSLESLPRLAYDTRVQGR